jgi:hypothetical protein
MPATTARQQRLGELEDGVAGVTHQLGNAAACFTQFAICASVLLFLFWQSHVRSPPSQRMKARRNEFRMNWGD